MPDSSPIPFGSALSLTLDDVAVRLAFNLPGKWSVERASVPTGGPFHDSEGRLHPRVTATQAGRTLQVSASRFAPPAGLGGAVVYWVQLYRLESFPEDESRWSGYAAYAGWFEDSNRLAAMAWIEAHGVVFEMRLEGPRSDREQLEATWLELRGSLECVPLTDGAVVSQTSEAAETWWARARHLSESGQLDAAIEVVRRDGDRAEALLMEAGLHAKRMRLALTASDIDNARAAWRQAVDCARAYASGATSGGEGVARSIECERILADIGAEP